MKPRILPDRLPTYPMGRPKVDLANREELLRAMEEGSADADEVLGALRDDEWRDLRDPSPGREPGL